MSGILAVKPYGKVYAILQSKEHTDNFEKFFNAEYFRFNQHGANVRLQELGEDYCKKSIKVKKSNSIREVVAVLLSEDIDIFKGVAVFESKIDADSELTKVASMSNSAKLITIDVVTNMTKAEQMATKPNHKSTSL